MGFALERLWKVKREGVVLELGGSGPWLPCSKDLSISDLHRWPWGGPCNTRVSPGSREGKGQNCGEMSQKAQGWAWWENGDWVQGPNHMILGPSPYQSFPDLGFTIYECTMWDWGFSDLPHPLWLPFIKKGQRCCNGCWEGRGNVQLCPLSACLCVQSVSDTTHCS